MKKPISSITLDDCKYNVQNLHVPRTTGLLLKLFVKLLYSRFGKIVLFPYFLRKSGLMLFDGVFLPENPTLVPLVSNEQPSEEKYASNNNEEIDKLMKLDAKRSNGHLRPVTISDYIQGYQLNKFTPLEVS